MSGNKHLAMIAAVGPNLELGIGGDLVWHISADLKNFKRLTMGHPIIMGRKTWDSLPKRPLPGRHNIVISHSLRDLEGASCVLTPEEALSVCREEEMPFVIGGAQVYETFLPLADRLYLTRVAAEAPEEVDAWFPEFRQDWRLDEAGEWMEDPTGVKYRFESWQRKD